MNIVRRYLKVSAITLCSILAINSFPCFGYGRTITADGNIVERKLDIFKGPISEIISNGMADIQFTQGNHLSIKLKGSKNILDYCHLRLANGVLTISEKNKPADVDQIRKYDVVVYITSPAIEKIIVNGTGDFDFTNTFTSFSLRIAMNGTGDVSIPSMNLEDFIVSISGTGNMKCTGKVYEANLSVSGTGDIDANITGLDLLKANITGTGDINLSGTTNSAKYSVSGTGDIFARRMIAKNVKASANGTGDITCYASDYFEGSRSSMTTITCYGNPKNRSLQSSGYAFPEGNTTTKSKKSSSTRKNGMLDEDDMTRIREQTKQADIAIQEVEQARQVRAQAREQARQARAQAAQAREQARQAREQAAQAREQARKARENGKLGLQNKAADNAVAEAIRKVREKGVKGSLSIDVNTEKNEIIIYKNKKIISKSYYSDGDYDSYVDYPDENNIKVIYHDDGGSTKIYYDKAGNQHIYLDRK